MASKPKVPFALHESVSVIANFDVPYCVDVALSPDGAIAAVNAAQWSERRLLLIDCKTGAVRDGLPQKHSRYELLPSWSPDGKRWAICAGEGSPAEPTGVITVGDRDGVTQTLTTPRLRCGTINSQARAAPVVEWAEDSATLVQRTTTRDERNALFFVDVASGRTRELWLDRERCDVFAHTISSHEQKRRVYALSASPGALAGLLWFDGESGAPSGALSWVFGVRLVATKRGVWAFGRPGYCFWVGETEAKEVVSARESREARLDVLAKRAKAKWDVDCVNKSFPRYLDPATTYNIACGRDGAAIGNQTPPPAKGMRCFENDLFWETSFAAPWGEDGVVVSDGVGVWRWAATDGGLDQVLLADDVQKSTHRGCRIVGLSAANDLVAVLWRKDATGAKGVLSLLKVR